MEMRKFLDMLLEVDDEKTLLEMNKILVGRLKDVRNIESVNSLGKLRGIPIGSRIEIRWRGQSTYHGTFTGMGRSKVHANIDELNGRGYRFPANWVVKVIEKEQKADGKKGKLEVVPPPPGDETERMTEAYAIRDEAKKMYDEMCNSPVDQKIDWDTRKKAEDALWERMVKLDERSKPGLQVGRLCSWQVADGHAHYIVVGIGRRVKLVHIMLWDAYHSDAVDDAGTATKSTVERIIIWHDKMKEMFPKKKANAGG